MKMKHISPDRWQAAATLCLLAVAEVGCGGSRHLALERARATYLEARQESQIVRHAPVALDRAAQALERAERAWQVDGDAGNVEHLAYIVEKRIEIARVSAKRRSSEQKIGELSSQRDKILLKARTSEVSRAQRESARVSREARREREKALDYALEAERAQESAAQAQEAAAKAQREEKRSREDSSILAREALEAKQRAEAARKAKEEISQWAKDLEEGLAHIQTRARHTQRGVVVTLEAVAFDPGEAEISPEAIDSLERVLAFLKKNPSHKLLVEGHTDNVGTSSQNLELSLRRADAVRDFLVRKGVKPERVSARGYGAAFPLVPNNNEAGRKQNRRVEIVISKDVKN